LKAIQYWRDRLSLPQPCNRTSQRCHRQNNHRQKEQSRSNQLHQYASKTWLSDNWQTRFIQKMAIKLAHVTEVYPVKKS